MSEKKPGARIEVIPNADAPQPFVCEWISCGERLPGTFSDEVVVVVGGWWSCEGWVARQCKFWRSHDGSPNWEACDEGLSATPTHWKEMAVPPAKEATR